MTKQPAGGVRSAEAITRAGRIDEGRLSGWNLLHDLLVRDEHGLLGTLDEHFREARAVQRIGKRLWRKLFEQGAHLLGAREERA